MCVRLIIRDDANKRRGGTEEPGLVAQGDSPEQHTI